jgi:hypothetical protein
MLKFGLGEIDASNWKDSCAVGFPSLTHGREYLYDS